MKNVVAFFRGVPADAGPDQRGNESLVGQNVERLLGIAAEVAADLRTQFAGQRAQRYFSGEIPRHLAQGAHQSLKPLRYPFQGRVAGHCHCQGLPSFHVTGLDIDDFEC